MNKLIKFFLVGIILIFLQVFVCNNILFLGEINPYFYIVFVFIYPLDINRAVFLISAFVMGLFIDFFSDTGGIHAFAILTIAYIRLFFVKLFFRKYPLDYPFFNINLESFGKRFNYVVTLTIIHHFLVLLALNFITDNLLRVVLNTFLSSIFTLLLYFLISFIFTKNSNA